MVLLENDLGYFTGTDIGVRRIIMEFECVSVVENDNKPLTAHLKATEREHLSELFFTITSNVIYGTFEVGKRYTIGVDEVK